MVFTAVDDIQDGEDDSEFYSIYQPRAFLNFLKSAAKRPKKLCYATELFLAFFPRSKHTI